MVLMNIIKWQLFQLSQYILNNGAQQMVPTYEEDLKSERYEEMNAERYEDINSGVIFQLMFLWN